MPDNQPHKEEGVAADSGLRRILIWVFGALIVTLVMTVLAVEFTLRWFGER